MQCIVRLCCVVIIVCLYINVEKASFFVNVFIRWFVMVGAVVADVALASDDGQPM